MKKQKNKEMISKNKKEDKKKIKRVQGNVKEQKKQ